jgi:hypothetical protein
MNDTCNYFMRDQAHHRVRRLMGRRLLPQDMTPLTTPFRPILLLALGILTAVNIMLVVP